MVAAGGFADTKSANKRFINTKAESLYNCKPLVPPDPVTLPAGKILAPHDRPSSVARFPIVGILDSGFNLKLLLQPQSLCTQAKQMPGLRPELRNSTTCHP